MLSGNDSNQDQTAECLHQPRLELGCTGSEVTNNEAEKRLVVRATSTSSNESRHSKLTSRKKRKEKACRDQDLRKIWFKGAVMSYAKDQNGSRLLQHKLENAERIEVAMVFACILPGMRDLAIDSYGNYVVQKFFEVGSPKQVNAILERLKEDILTFSCHTYGCRVVQKALECLALKQQVTSYSLREK